MFEGNVRVGRKVTFHDQNKNRFVIGNVHRIINKKESEIRTERGDLIIINNKKLRTIKT